MTFVEELEPVLGPNLRAFRHLVRQRVPAPELAGDRLDVALRREKTVRSPFHDEPPPPLSHHDTARAPLALEHDHLCPGPDQLPRGRQAGEASPDDDARHTHPRSTAVRRARSASAATSNGSSFNESVRSSRTPSRSASPRYATSMSYKTST